MKTLIFSSSDLMGTYFINNFILNKNNKIWNIEKFIYVSMFTNILKYLTTKKNFKQVSEITQERKGLKIAYLEEIALLNKWLTKRKLKLIIKTYPSSNYKNYIKKNIKQN